MVEHCYPGSATEALIAKWRAEAKRHEAAAEEPNMDAQEYTLHDECHRVYSKCADELARISAAQAPAYPVTTPLRERIALVLLSRRGFGFYSDPMEGGQDAYDLTIEALNEADAVISALPNGVAQARLNPADWEGLRQSAALEIWHRFADSGTEEWANETHKAEYLMCADAILGHAFGLEAIAQAAGDASYWKEQHKVAVLKHIECCGPCRNCGDPISDVFCGTCREMGCTVSSTQEKTP